MEIEIIAKCPVCDGYGYIADRHPNDPSARDIKCQECDGEGQKASVQNYDSIADAKADYPSAISITEKDK